jgi:hypothetical protein
VLQVFVPPLRSACSCSGSAVRRELPHLAGFMRFIGRIAWWKSIVTALVFSVVMFVTFDVAFDVIMPKGPIEALFGK